MWLDVSMHVHTYISVTRCIVTLKSFPKLFVVHFSSPPILISSDHWFVFSYSFSNSRISYKYIIQFELFSLKLHFWDSSKLSFTSICSFFYCKVVFHCINIIFLAHLFVNGYLSYFQLWLLWVKLLWLFTYLHRHAFSFLLVEHLGMESFPSFLSPAPHSSFLGSPPESIIWTQIIISGFDFGNIPNEVPQPLHVACSVLTDDGQPLHKASLPCFFMPGTNFLSPWDPASMILGHIKMLLNHFSHVDLLNLIINFQETKIFSLVMLYSLLSSRIYLRS